jgi:dihydrofolate reductase
VSKVFVNVGLSLDGYLAPEGMTMGQPEFMNWGAKWGAMMAWALKQQHLRDLLGLGPGGETGPVNDLLRATSERIGANIMGKRMFDQGEVAWPEEAPFHTPVYVLTHLEREPWVRPGGTTFHFVTDGPERALARAREAAGPRDVRICGGADAIQQYLNLGAVDELEIALAPVLFCGGRRLFENLREPASRFRIDRVLEGPDATHLRYVRS